MSFCATVGWNLADSRSIEVAPLILFKISAVEAHTDLNIVQADIHSVGSVHEIGAGKMRLYR